MNKVTKAASDIANDPATAIALGSAFMAAANGGIEGVYVNMAAAFGIACLKGYESWTGREQGRPFAALALVNFGTAVSVGGHAYMDHGMNPAILQKALITGTYFFSGIRSTLLALQKKRGLETTSFINDPQFFQGLACMGASGLRPVQFALASLGLARTFIKDGASQPGFLRRHYTAARTYATQYGVSAVQHGVTVAQQVLQQGAMVAPTTIQNAAQAIGFALWSWGFTRFDRALNRELVAEIKNVVRYKRDLSP
jgi:hypothetical protein